MSIVGLGLQASHSNAQKQLQRTSQNLADSIASIDTFEEQLQSAGGRYTFLQEIKAYIADLCDMLQVSSLCLQALLLTFEDSGSSVACHCCAHFSFSNHCSMLPHCSFATTVDATNITRTPHRSYGLQTRSFACDSRFWRSMIENLSAAGQVPCCGGAARSHDRLAAAQRAGHG